jgi:ABC-type spermidine/putrescine transport system permease subunit I
LNELVFIYLRSLGIALGIEITLTLLGIPLAYMHKLKYETNVKEYLVDAIIINVLTSPLFAFSILAFTFILKVINL